MDIDESDNESIPENQNDKDFKLSDVNYDNDSENSYESCENETNGNDDDMINENDDAANKTSFPGGHKFNKKLVCIRYPGNVVNPDKAVETLGGISSISTAVKAPNRRLELRFRPSDGYCKPACGDRFEVTGLLLRIRVKKSRVEHLQSLSKQNEPLKRDTISAMPKNQIKKVVNENQNLDDLMARIQRCSVNADHNYSSHQTTIAPSEEARFKAAKVIESIKSAPGKPPGDKTISFEPGKLEDLSEDQDYQLPKLKVLGKISTEFRFTGLCDFQFLPITVSPDGSGKNECIYEYLYPKGIPSFRWLDNKVPYFLPPAVFSRIDNVQSINFKTETKDMGPDNIIGKTRKRRGGFTNFIHFSSPLVPMSSSPGLESAMKVKILGQTHLETMKALFNERPIWSKTAVMYKTKFSSEQLKILLPAVAYYFITGPWRIMWVKLGYDPRTDPSARIYQMLDYRLKSMYGLEHSIKGKRNYTNYILPHKSASISKPKTAILTNLVEIKNKKKGKNLSENVYIYKEGFIPPWRQMFYQYCDILVPEVEEMFAKLPDPQPGAKCHEKRGWLPNGFSDQVREIISKQVRTLLRKQMNIPEDHPTSLPRKRKFNLKLNSRNAKRRKVTKKKNTEANTSNTSIRQPAESDENWEDT